MMTAQMLPPLSCHATGAIIAQLVFAANGDSTRYATVDGEEREFTVHYSTDWRRERDDHGCMGNVADCEITGAWVADPETGDAAWAGNVTELEALVGEQLVATWQDEISENVTAGGRW
jgi:hypothetical protein